AGLHGDARAAFADGHRHAAFGSRPRIDALAVDPHRRGAARAPHVAVEASGGRGDRGSGPVGNARPAPRVHLGALLGGEEQPPELLPQAVSPYEHSHEKNKSAFHFLAPPSTMVT